MRSARIPLFLLAEIVLYALILTTSGSVLVTAEFAAICLCFLFALCGLRKENRMLLCALACTVGADFCLVVCTPIQQLYGMLFFTAVQIFYAVYLHKIHPVRWLLTFRSVLTLSALLLALIVLGKHIDLLAVVSLCYYANLLGNCVAAFCHFRKVPKMAIGFVLFILCDTVIGLQVAAGGYLPIPEGSLLGKILFMDFHLSWFFYLPSQVLLALQTEE